MINLGVMETPSLLEEMPLEVQEEGDGLSAPKGFTVLSDDTSSGLYPTQPHTQTHKHSQTRSISSVLMPFPPTPLPSLVPVSSLVQILR